MAVFFWGKAPLPTEDEIRALCLLVLQAKSDGEFEKSLGNLRSALTQHFLELENLGIHMLLKMPKQTALTFAKKKNEDEKEPKD